MKINEIKALHTVQSSRPAQIKSAQQYHLAFSTLSEKTKQPSVQFIAAYSYTAPTSSFLSPSTLPALVYSTTTQNDGLLVRTSSKTIRALALCLRNHTHCQFRSLVDIAVVDRLRAPTRFSITYLFLSIPTNQRVLVQLFASETSTIPSLSVPYANGQRYFASAGWLEREA